jgi:hypothetical protein
MDEQHDIDAIGLLRHLVNQVMQQRNLDELEDAVGVSIVPLGATGLWAGDGFRLPSLLRGYR